MINEICDMCDVLNKFGLKATIYRTGEVVISYGDATVRGTIKDLMYLMDVLDVEKYDRDAKLKVYRFDEQSVLLINDYEIMSINDLIVALIDPKLYAEFYEFAEVRYGEWIGYFEFDVEILAYSTINVLKKLGYEIYRAEVQEHSIKVIIREASE